MDRSEYILDRPFAGYDAGTVLRNVTLAEARAIECNRCGDCCNGLRDGVKKDEASGMPLFEWGSKFPQDRYRERYGKELLLPIVRGDGGPDIGDDFEMAVVNGKLRPFTAFKCSFLIEHEAGAEYETTCELKANYPDPDPKRLEQIRPRNCGEFPVFGLDVDATIIDGNSFVPPTGALPRCSWHGIRVTGPWKPTVYWRDRWERQQVGLPVEEALAVDPAIIDALLARRETIDGSRKREPDSDPHP